MYNAHHLGLLPDVAGYFAAHDDGIHVVAFLILQQLEHNRRRNETYPDFLLRLEREHQLNPGALEAQFLAEPTHYTVKALLLKLAGTVALITMLEGQMYERASVPRIRRRLLLAA